MTEDLRQRAEQAIRVVHEMSGINSPQLQATFVQIEGVLRDLLAAVEALQQAQAQAERQRDDWMRLAAERNPPSAETVLRERAAEAEQRAEAAERQLQALRDRLEGLRQEMQTDARLSKSAAGGAVTEVTVVNKGYTSQLDVILMLLAATLTPPGAAPKESRK